MRGYEEEYRGDGQRVTIGSRGQGLGDWLVYIYAEDGGDSTCVECEPKVARILARMLNLAADSVEVAQSATRTSNEWEGGVQ